MDGLERLLAYFPELTPKQRQQFARMEGLYRDWNAKINVISRKDIDELYLRHVLHSLAIAKFIRFLPEARVLDVGTGGGFPGIPLAIMFPDSYFTLADSIGKKMKVVQSVVDDLELENVLPLQSRAEQIPARFDFVVSRAVTELKTFIPWVWDKIIPGGKHPYPNGIIYLKGGDLREELKACPQKALVTDLTEYFQEDFFETKKLIYIQK